MESRVWKLMQKRTYDLLSHRYGLLMIIAGGIVITVSAFHFGEALLEWSHEKYAAVFNSFSDNLARRSYRERLCLPVPIDVVYTWVNGSDPELILQLREVKMSMEEQLNITRTGQCTYRNCVPSPVVIVAAVPFTESHLLDMQVRYSLNVSHTFNYSLLTSSGKIDSMALELFSWTEAKVLSGRKYQRGDVNHTLIQAYYTSDNTLPHATELNDKVLMTGFPYEYTSELILEKLPEDHRKNVERVELHSEKGVAVLHMKDAKGADSILQLKNFTVEGKHPTFTKAYMLSDITDLSRGGDVSNSRFEDNEELRYSLRSLERFAPWVRHVYIVTNGQIPYWLNLDNPRISLITHQELFPNKSHLPTYSSPAIESHLHRIPGLSDKFLYFNDDVMFGEDVWPDDFFTFGDGQKLYLTWPVPSCNEGCPSNWIRDGYCDKACNSSVCEWDGGDCSGVQGQVQLGAGFQAAFGPMSQNTEEYCHVGCANNWIADKYCDQACNHLMCGFDAGDCGTSHYDQLYGQDLRKESSQHYDVLEGETMAYFNLTQVLGPHGKVTSASHRTSKVVRAAAVSNKFKVLTLILYPDHNATRLTFQLKGHRDTEEDKFELNFTVSVNTSSESLAKKKLRDKMASNLTDDDEEEELVLFEEYPKNILVPQIGTPALTDQGVGQFPFNISGNLTVLGLSPGLSDALAQVMADKADSVFTEKGFQTALAEIYRHYLSEIKAWTPHRKPTPLLHKTYKNATTNIKHHNREKLNLDQPEKIPSNGQRKLLASQDMDNIEEEDEGNYGGVIHKTDHAHRKLLASQDRDIAEEDSNDGGFVHMTVLDEGVVSRKVGGKMNDNEKERVSMTDEEFLEFLKQQGKENGADQDGGLPWEVQGVFSELEKRQKELQQAEIYEMDNHKGRRLLDTFGDSLRHVNRLYNKLFGFASRKVPAHMPHMIDKHIMAELQEIFAKEWEVTSSHVVRSPDDMQFAFSYYYYLLGAVVPVDVDTVFDDMDTDHSGILSDRELRTLATRINELPLYLETLTGMEKMMLNCSQHLPDDLDHRYRQQVLTMPSEQYYDEHMPQVTKLLFSNCEAMVKQIKEKFKPVPKYRTTILDDSSIAFKMIQGNVSKVVGQLDDIRKNPRKFICLNDNIDHGSEEAKTVKAVIQDFYESVLPVPSQFELPREYRNRFLHMNDLSEWKKYRDWLRFWAHLALVLLVLFTITSYFGDKIEALQRRWSRTRNRSDSSTSDSDDTSVPVESPPLLTV